MQSSLPYHYRDYQQPYSCGLFFQQTDNASYNTHACQYAQRREALVDWQSAADYQSLSSGSSHAKLSASLRFHVPAYRYLQPQRGWGVQRAGRTAGHTISNMSPPAVTRCVSALSSPFIGDRQNIAFWSSSSQQTRDAAGLVCSVSTGQASTGCDVYSTQPTPSDRVKWMDGGLSEHSDLNVPVLRSDHICRSLVDTSHRPAALNDAICMYIDYLTRDNDRVIGDFSVTPDERRTDPALSTLVNDHLYRDVFCQPSSFPTSRFREWLRIYSVDLEITDPEGRKLAEATFPGCGCEEHQMQAQHGLLKNMTAYQDHQSESQNAGVSCNQPDLGVFAATTVPPRLVLDVDQTYGVGSRGGSGRGGRPPGRGSGRGRGRGAKRKSDWHYSASSHPSAGQSRQFTSDVRRTSLSIVDTECRDDSAVVEFLASLQSNAVKRRSREQQQQELASQQLTSSQHFNSPRTLRSDSHGQVRVIEELVDDELQVDDDDDDMSTCHNHRQQQHHVVNIRPQSESSVNVGLPALTKHQFSSEYCLPSSSPTVGEHPYALPVKVVDVDDTGNMVGKSSEQ